MSKLVINTGTTPNDGTGDSLLVGAGKINSNFTEIYSSIGDGANLGIASFTQLNVSGASTFTGITTVTGVTLFSKQLNVSGVSTFGSDVTIGGNLTVNGTTSTINSTTITVDDKNIELGSTASPSDATADGGGITLKGTSDKTFNWVNSTTSWTSSEDLNLLTGKQYEINGTSVLTSTTLGSGVVNSSLTSVGTLGQLTVSGVTTSSGGFVGNITGTATTATNLANAANITTGTISNSRLTGSYNIDISGNSATASYATISGYSTSSGISTTATTAGYATTSGISTTSQGLTGTPNITVGIITATNVTIGTATTALIVTGNAKISGATTITGNLNAAGNYYVKLARLTNQTVTSGSDSLIGFSAVSDPNSWYSGITTRTTPTVAGTYHVDVMLNWNAGTISTDQSNIQIRKNGVTFALSQVGIRTFGYTQNACGIVTLNGTTDYIDFTVYTANPTSQVVTGTADGAWTKMEIFKIN